MTLNSQHEVSRRVFVLWVKLLPLKISGLTKKPALSYTFKIKKAVPLHTYSRHSASLSIASGDWVIPESTWCRVRWVNIFWKVLWWNHCLLVRVPLEKCTSIGRHISYTGLHYKPLPRPLQMEWAHDSPLAYFRNRRCRYSQYRTGNSLQMRLKLGMFSNANDIPPHEPSLRANSTSIPGKRTWSIVQQGN